MMRRTGRRAARIDKVDEREHGAIVATLSGAKYGHIGGYLRTRNIRARNRKGETILITLTKYENIRAVKEILKTELDANLGDFEYGRTALMYAAMKPTPQSLHIMELFLSEKYHHKIHVNKKDKDGWTALDYAKANKNGAAVELLRKNNGREGIMV